jgi:hypothetical protein
MIPTLMHPSRGGLVFHQAVGGWLRAQGASSLIYPSARRDVQVRVENRQISSHDGWNLVAYGSEDEQLPDPPTDLAHFGFLGKWLTATEISATIGWCSSENARWWRVSGVANREAAHRDYAILDSLHHSHDQDSLRSRLETIGFDFTQRI